MLIEKYNIPFVCVTLGKDGSRAYYKGMHVEVPGFVQKNTIETTGAGDTFCGCMLHYIIQHGLEAVSYTHLAEKLDNKNYECFKQDLKQAKTLTYVLDNCGEIVLDKLLIKEIKRQYPKLQISVLVRGKEVLNDVTMEDAIQTGLTKMVPVIENGTGIAGTVLEKISKEAKEALNEADIILAKGQGNFESMYGCGLNVYYLFLCKCDWFVKRFAMTKNAGVFLREGEYICLLYTSRCV